MIFFVPRLVLAVTAVIVIELVAVGLWLCLPRSLT